MYKDLLTLRDINSSELKELFELTKFLKEGRGKVEGNILNGKSIGLLFAKSSTRTRVSFEVGVHELGGYPLYLDSTKMQLGRGETVADTANVLSRYIGTVVLPRADVKIFLTASAEVRAQRRHLELQQKGSKDSFEKVLADIQKRDHQDSTRAIAPLKPAKDSVVVDTSELDIDGVVTAIRAIVTEKTGV